VKAHYLAQYLLTVQYDPASIQPSFNETHAGWYDANVNVQLGPTPPIVDLSSVERLRFLGWIENDTTASNPSITILMNKPQKVTLSYETQYYVEVRSSYGSVTGSGWYDKGSIAKISAFSTAGTWPFSYKFGGWTVDPSVGKLNQVDDSWTLLVDRPYVVQANWHVDYLPLIGLIGGGAAFTVVLVVAIVIGRKRGLLTRERATPALKPAVLPSGRGEMQLCASCGSQIPKGALFCQKCGATAALTPSLSSSEERVYDYIVKHNGVISLSKASVDLDISVDQLKKITERLKKEGRLA
jgi:ribosomal protein L40E